MTNRLNREGITCTLAVNGQINGNGTDCGLNIIVGKLKKSHLRLHLTVNGGLVGDFERTPAAAG